MTIGNTNSIANGIIVRNLSEAKMKMADIMIMSPTLIDKLKLFPLLKNRFKTKLPTT
jgi:hypothetical protein